MGCTPSRPRRSLNSSLSRPSYNRRCALPPPANHSSKRFLKLPKGNGPKFVHVKMQVEDRVICDMVVKKQEFERNLGDNLHLPLTLNWSNVKLIVEATGGDLKSSSTEPEIEKSEEDDVVVHGSSEIIGNLKVSPGTIMTIHQSDNGWEYKMHDSNIYSTSKFAVSYDASDKPHISFKPLDNATVSLTEKKGKWLYTLTSGDVHVKIETSQRFVISGAPPPLNTIQHLGRGLSVWAHMDKDAEEELNSKRVSVFVSPSSAP
ncbi:hypothetical protein M3Y95_01114300 [Aphelenchoides besseyi]|nr:hypothetical protein M3Y95_01114300 [Aphelenchoides besseyi]